MDGVRGRERHRESSLEQRPPSRNSKGHQATQHNDVSGHAHTKSNFKHFGQRCTFHPTCFCETHVLSNVFHQAAEEVVGTASSGGRAEFFSVTKQSDNTGGLEQCKYNTSTDPFSRCATSFNYGYSLS